MSIAVSEKLVNGIILLILSVCIIIKSKSIAKACRDHKVKVFGVAKYDDRSELIARCGIIFIGVCFGLGSFLQIYQFIVAR